MKFSPFNFSSDNLTRPPSVARQRGASLLLLLPLLFSMGLTQILPLSSVHAQVSGSGSGSGSDTGSGADTNISVVTAQVSPARIRPGGFASYSIMVQGGGAASLQQPALPQGLELGNPGKSTSTDVSIINGRRTQRFTQSWQITSEKPGKYVIPAQEIQVDGRSVKTEPVEFTVVAQGDAAASPTAEYSQYDPMISIEAEKREFYMGEIVPLTANLYIHERTLLRRVGLIELPKDNFAIQRFPLQAEENATIVAGVPYRVLTYRSTMSALKSGKYTLGPATSEIILDMPSQDNPLPHPFLMQSDPQKVRPKSNDIEINVLPLPDEGKPASFTGVVGDFQMNITAEPMNVAVGEPISVELTISGTGNFDAIVEPKMADASKWRVYPARRFNMNTPDGFDGSNSQQIGFSQVIIPQQQVTSVPSYEFSFFSPTEKKYITLRTNPVPLEVTAGKAAVSPSGEGMAGDAPKTPMVQPPAQETVPRATPQLTDILPYVPENATWLNSSPPPWKSEQFILTSTVAGAVLITLLLGKLTSVIMVANRNAPDAVARAIWKSMGRSGQTVAQFYSNAAHYIKEKQLHGAEVAAVLHRYDEVNFSPDHETGQQNVSAQERDKVMQTLRSAAASPAAKSA